MTTTEEIVYNNCLHTDETNPIELYNKIIKLDDFPMHGPMHHFLIPAIFLACRHNLLKIETPLKNDLDIALARAKIVPGGFCASNGSCGAGLGVSIFVSIVTNNNPLSELSWQQTIDSNIRCQIEIAKNGGPRCCKRNSYLSIIEGIKFSKEVLEIEFEKPKKGICFKFKENKQCKKEKCLFYKVDQN